MPASSSRNANTESSSPKRPTEFANPSGDLEPTIDAIDYLKEYARQRPEVAALWCVGIGFVLGWKLKPW
jgi:hypothetical protein